MSFTLQHITSNRTLMNTSCRAEVQNSGLRRHQRAHSSQLTVP
jgi:hypothetical protein